MSKTRFEPLLFCSEVSTNYIEEYIDGQMNDSDIEYAYYYDTCVDSAHDNGYFSVLYPYEARIIKELVDNELDKHEFEGSFLFHEYPDRIYLDRIFAKIYRAISERLQHTAMPQETSSGDITWDEADNDTSDDVLMSLQSLCSPKHCAGSDTYTLKAAAASDSPDYLWQLGKVIYLDNILCRRRRYHSIKHRNAKNRSS